MARWETDLNPAQANGKLPAIPADDRPGVAAGDAGRSDGEAACPSEIGPRLRRARRSRRLRLVDVAREVGCSVSLLSKIETGKATPSLRTLHRIVRALGTSIVELLAARSEREFVIYRVGQRPVIHIAGGAAKGAISLEQLAPFSPTRLLDANVHVVAPGADNGGTIRHDGEEIGFVAAGEVELTVAGETHRLRAGDSFFFRSQLPHGYRNVGKDEARIVWVATPPTF
jgi:transcriptional regulator with XRE-family HTH domain